MTTLNIRNIDEAAVAKLKRAAAARGMTLGVYVARLAELHDLARTWTMPDDLSQAYVNRDMITDELTALGLQTVTG